MSTILYEVNEDTTTDPVSYYPSAVSRGDLTEDDLAKLISDAEPTLSEVVCKTTILLIGEVFAEYLARGLFVDLDGFIIFDMTFTSTFEFPNSWIDYDLFEPEGYCHSSFVQNVLDNAEFELLRYTFPRAPYIVGCNETEKSMADHVQTLTGLVIDGEDFAIDTSDQETGVWIESPAGVNYKQDRISLNEEAQIIITAILSGDFGAAGPNSVERTLSVRSRYEEGGSVGVGVYGKKIRGVNRITHADRNIFLTGVEISGIASISDHSFEVGDTLFLVALITDSVLSITINYNDEDGNTEEITANGTYNFTAGAETLSVLVEDWETLQANIENYGSYMVERVYIEQAIGLPFPDTGQTTVYQSGDDGSYGYDVTDDDDSNGHAGFSFTKLDQNGHRLANDATAWEYVREDKSGLVFKYNGVIDEKWDDVMDNAAAFSGLGRTWRLPTPQELVFLCDYSKTGGVIDAMVAAVSTGVAFTNTPVDGGSVVWGVNLATGETDNTVSQSAAPRPQFFVSGDEISASLVDNLDGTITNTTTGLMYSSVITSTDTWSNCISAAEASSYAGYSDWRMPNIKELQTILEYDDSVSTSALDSAFFTTAAGTILWTSTTYAGDTAKAWAISLFDADEGRALMQLPIHNKTEATGAGTILVRNE